MTGGTSDRPTDPPDHPPTDPPPDRGITRLLELGAKRATGALHLSGRRGVVYLDRGEVAYVESPLTPGVAALLLRPRYAEDAWAGVVPELRRGETDDAATAAAELLRSGTATALHAEILRRGATADAALAALGRPAPDARSRPRFRPGERHWCPVGRTDALPDVLTEVRRRTAVLARLAPGVRPDLPVGRSPHLWFDRVRLTAAQWDVVRLADGRRTPVDVAWLLGHGVFATTVAVHQLAKLGVLTVGPHGAGTPGIGPSTVPPHVVLSFLRGTAETAGTVPPLPVPV